MTQRRRGDKKVPPEIAEIRKRRRRHHAHIGFVFWFAWLGLFLAGTALNNNALMYLAFAASMASLAVAYGEDTLRKIAGRPQANYKRIDKLQRKLLPPPPKGDQVKLDA